MTPVHVTISMQSLRDPESPGRWLRFDDELRGLVRFADARPPSVDVVPNEIHGKIEGAGPKE